MSSAYRRLLNEYNKLINIYNFKYFQNITYKLYTIDSNNIMFKSIINFNYNNKMHEVKIYYDKLYPFKCPTKIEINNINIDELYKNIMSKNKSLLDKNLCLCCKSLLCDLNWNISKNIYDILKEIKLIIDYKELYVNRLLLNKIIQKYTNESMDYLEKYLL